MNNHCAYCHDKFGLMRRRRAFKSFCSQKCVDHYEAWPRAEVGKRNGWSDYLWSASLSVVPYAGERNVAAALGGSAADCAEEGERARFRPPSILRGRPRPRKRPVFTWPE